MEPAARRWAELLDGWVIPDEILFQAPESPWTLEPALFTAPAEPADTPARRLALEMLPDGGSVLDVGCGGGLASLALVPPARRVTGVDSSAGMLQRFASACEERGVSHAEIEGDWPAISRAVPVADVVVCRHVAYNARDLVAFAVALSGAARKRVVLTMASVHPSVRLAPLWQHFWRLERPRGPTADDALDVLREASIEPVVERWQGERTLPASFDEEVQIVRRRLCLPASRDADVAKGLSVLPRRPHETVAYAWGGDG